MENQTSNNTTYIAPDGKLYTYMEFVNWKGYRPVEGVTRKKFEPGIHTVKTSDFIHFTISD